MYAVCTTLIIIIFLHENNISMKHGTCKQYNTVTIILVFVKFSDQGKIAQVCPYKQKSLKIICE
jgi:hypothetical protein